MADNNASKLARSYLVSSEDLTSPEIKMLRDRAAQRLLDQAITEGFISSAAEAVVRDGLPNTDFGLAQRLWAVPAAALPLVAGTQFTYVNFAVPNNKVIAVYGLGIRDARMNVSSISFQEGAGATTYAVFELEQLYTRMETAGYFSMPVIYPPNKTMFIVGTPGAADALAPQITLYTLVLEQLGANVSRNPELAG